MVWRVSCLEYKRDEFWINIKNNPLYDSNRKMVGILGVSTNITKRKEYENELKESESRFRSLVENSPTGIINIDLKGNILDINKKLLEILGSPSEEATKKINFFEFKPLIDAGVTEVFNEEPRSKLRGI